MVKWKILLYILLILLLCHVVGGCSYTNRRHNLMHYRQMKEDWEEMHKTIDSWIFDVDY